MGPVGGPIVGGLLLPEHAGEEGVERDLAVRARAPFALELQLARFDAAWLPVCPSTSARAAVTRSSRYIVSLPRFADGPL